MKFQVKKAWVLSRQKDLLLINGGADEVYELQIENEDSIFNALENHSYDSKLLSASDLIVHEQLLSAGIVQPTAQVRQTPLSIAWLGEDLDLFTTVSISGFRNVARIKDADVVVVVRTTQTYEKLLSTISYDKLAKPHILIDLAYHSIVSVGPLVFPRETACLACLEGRIRQRWGDTQPPPRPRSSNVGLGFARGVVEAELQKFAEGDFRLIGKTVAWNFDQWEATVRHLYKVVYCPLCNQKT